MATVSPSSGASTVASTPSYAASTPSSATSFGTPSSTPAATSQRSTVTLQQLTAFALRNVALPGAPTGELLDLYFKLVIDGHVVYVSEIVRNTLNPVWMPFEPDALAHLSHNMDGLHHHVSVAPLLSGTGFDIVVVRVRNYKMARRKSSALLGVIMADEDGLMLRKVTRTRESSDDCSVDAGDDMEDKAKRNIPAVQEVDPSVATGFYFSGIHQPKKQRGAFDFSDDEDAEGEASDAFPADGPVVPSASNTLVSSFRLNNSSKRNDNSIVYEEEIFCFRFNIRELDPLPIGLTEISNLPLNTCLLEFNDRLYVKREVIELLVEMGVISVKHSRRKGSAIQLKEYSLHDGIDNLERIRALRKHIKDVTHGNAELKDQIKQRLVAAETTVQKDHSRTAVQDRIQALRRQIAEKKNALDRVKHIMHDERRTFETDIHIPKALLHMMQMSIRYKDEKQGILERRCEVLRAAHKIRSRQAMLVKELTTIYPIEYIGAGEKAIRGIRVLDSDLTINGRGDEEQISTALGYIAHLTFMLSKYLHVNLRYKIVPYSSRSYMKDEINDPHGEYPLYRKGVERERFERAIFFLRKDVEQLLFARGLDPTQGAPLLGRLDTLIKAEISWLEAERDMSNGGTGAATVAPSPRR